MDIHKNKTNNYKGRTPGAKNKLQRETRELISQFINGKLETIESIFNELSPSDKMNTIIKLSRYVLPTLRSVEIVEPLKDEKELDLSLWTTEDLNRLIELKDKYGIEEL